ncbi:xanthine dehydrogenase accessory factor [Actinoplanes lutulentus]|uniref:Xanthine dehydrogenase accessory factor n=1 Tax=Actinoplanes lutulentus TaxID=1287878 RepID=A0A327ZP41_9ACTN|nr:XdhC family protein [Actinoplanes lutulentus]MBB2944470.1 xanthine dehydrogenase accessory factor [Actinoplanes lutulentus]RAK42298.1 xanthine dehydrogenase accessory factor [Actinoplanes lutulentus]
MTTTTAERARELTEARRPFVHATVVRAQEPTSARAGDDAVILADGSIEGFVGGVCAETSVRAAAMESLRDGNTVLLRVLPEDEAGFPETPGALVVVNPCHSGGAIEIFLRPVLPKPLVAVAGTTPIGAAVTELATFLDFDISPSGAYAGVTAAVVAGLGRDEERAIRGALDAGVGLIALVASHKRAAVVLDAMELSEDERERIRPHAGLDIGARTPKEIALAIMGEIVRELRVGGLATSSRTTSGHPAMHGESAALAKAEPEFVAGPTLPVGPITLETPAATAIDPICGMTVVIGPDTPHGVVDGEDYWFCCPGCRKKFTAAR